MSEDAYIPLKVSEVAMELLLYKRNEEFQKYIWPYKKYIQPFLECFQDEIREKTQVGLHPIVQSNFNYMQWPIKKIEYSYVLRQSMNHVREGTRVLDAGCGVSPLIRSFARQRCRAYGVDSSKETIRILSFRPSKLHDPAVHYSRQDIRHLAFSNGMFDLVTCVSVLEHLPAGDDTVSIGEMLRVLKVGGKLVVTVDFLPGLSKMEWLVRILGAFVREPLGLLEMGIKNFNAILEKRAPPGPYTPAKLTRFLIEPYYENLQEGDISVPSLTDVREFWKSHEWAGKHPGYSRDYVSLGFTMRKARRLSCLSQNSLDDILLSS